MVYMCVCMDLVLGLKMSLYLFERLIFIVWYGMLWFMYWEVMGDCVWNLKVLIM